MKRIFLSIAIGAAVLAGSAGATAQVQSGSEVRKRTTVAEAAPPTAEAKAAKTASAADATDASLVYDRLVLRRLDLTKGANGALYYPEETGDGRDNLFRQLLSGVVEGRIPAYEFTEAMSVGGESNKLDVKEMLSRYSIPAQEGRGTARNPKFSVAPGDVPATRVLYYYILERWQFDRRRNAMRTYVEALCPVLNGESDFGEEVRYPMFWVRTADVAPLLASISVMTDDDNNLERYSLQDFFAMGMYEGELYKTKNMRNLSLAEMYPDPDDLKRAQDSIDHRLRTFGTDIWVPTREEALAAREKADSIARARGELPEKKTVVSRKDIKPRQPKKSSTKSKVQKSQESEAAAGAVRSVRRRRR